MLDLEAILVQKSAKLVAVRVWGSQFQRKNADYKTSTITDEEPLRGLVFY